MHPLDKYVFWYTIHIVELKKVIKLKICFNSSSLSHIFIQFLYLMFLEMHSFRNLQQLQGYECHLYDNVFIHTFPSNNYATASKQNKSEITQNQYGFNGRVQLRARENRSFPKALWVIFWLKSYLAADTCYSNYAYTIIHAHLKLK